MEAIRNLFYLILVIGLTVGVGYGMSWISKGQLPAKSWGDYVATILTFTLVFIGAWLQQR